MGILEGREIKGEITTQCALKPHLLGLSDDYRHLEIDKSEARPDLTVRVGPRRILCKGPGPTFEVVVAGILVILAKLVRLPTSL